MTNEEINALTDPQINVMVTRCVHNAECYTQYDEKNNFIYSDDSVHGVLNGIKVEDYCNDPAVMMPIVIKEKINLISSTGDLWGASWNDGGGKWSIDDYKHHHKNPLRAAAIVYLKMKGFCDGI